MRDPIDPRFAELMQRYTDGALSEADSDELNYLLRDDPAMRDAFVGYCLHARLTGETLRRDDAGETEAPAVIDRIDAAASSARSRTAWMGIAAAVLIAAAAVAITLTIINPEPTGPKYTGKPIAVLTDSANVTWVDDVLETGDPLPPRPIRTQSGRVSIQFDSGAALATRGASELELTSEMRCRLIRGVVAMQVPPSAQGFTVETNSFEVVDLGTGFGMSTEADGSGQVHVFEGEVELRLAGGQSLKLRAGEAARIDATGAVVMIGPEVFDYPIVADTPAERWAEMTRRLVLDDDVALLLPMDELPDEPTQIADLADADRKIRVLGGTMSAGRFAGTTAMRFSEPTDGLAVDLPESVDAYTMAMWVKFDGLPTDYTSLIQTERYDLDETHWNVGPTGTLTIGVQGGVVLSAPGALDVSHTGRWVHLAVTNDRIAGEMALYVDGQPVATRAHRHGRPFRFGPSRIGCWDSTPRVLRGSVDDVWFLSRGLDADEIKDIYEAGRLP